MKFTRIYKAVAARVAVDDLQRLEKDLWIFWEQMAPDFLAGLPRHRALRGDVIQLVFDFFGDNATDTLATSSALWKQLSSDEKEAVVRAVFTERSYL